MRHVIVGSGVAGIAAVEGIRSIDKYAEITMIGDDPHGYYSRPGLAYYLAGEITDQALFPRTREDYQHLDFKFHSGCVTRIQRVENLLEVGQKTHVPYDRLLIAVGAQAIPLTVPGANLAGVVKLDHLNDARGILKLAKRGRTAVVVGGGITALELVEGLLARGVRVHYLLRGDRYWGNVLDEHESRAVERRLQQDGVTLHFHSEVLEITGKSGKVVRIRLLDGRTMKCDILAYAIGIKPRLELAREAGLAVDRGILVNEFLQTNDPAIYAAGDAAQVYDPNSGRSVLDSLWNPAREQGRAAGLNMCGRKTPYLKTIPFNVTRLAGLTTTIIGNVGQGRDQDIVGIARGDSETWRQLPQAIVVQGGFEINRVRLMVGEKHLIGAVVMGDQTLSVPLQRMIAGRADISPIRERLLATETNLAEVVIDFWSKNRASMPGS